VKQIDLGGYEENAREKHKIQIYKIKHQLPLKPIHKDGKYQVSNSIGQQPKLKVSQWQSPQPPKTKANQNKRQTQIKMVTPPEVENTKFHQLSLDKPQNKNRPLKQ
jgi:hypothetical protein